MSEPLRSGSMYPSGGGVSGGREPTSLGDILERVLDRGVIIAGDIRVNLLDIELLTIKLRLIIASVDTARELGIDWWQNDPWLSGRNESIQEENRRLRERIEALEEGLLTRRAQEHEVAAGSRAHTEAPEVEAPAKRRVVRSSSEGEERRRGEERRD